MDVVLWNPWIAKAKVGPVLVLSISFGSFTEEVAIQHYVMTTPMERQVTRCAR